MSEPPNIKPYKYKSYILTDEERDILEQLCKTIMPPGSEVLQPTTAQVPALAEGGEITRRLFYIEIKDPIIKALARRAIADGIGGEYVGPRWISFKADSEGREEFKFIPRDDGGTSYPAFYDMHIYYNTFSKETFKRLGYKNSEIINGLWDFLNGRNDFFFKCFMAWQWPQTVKQPPQTYTASAHLERAKFGLVPKNQQLSLWDYDPGFEEDAKNYPIESIGLNLSYGQSKALDAVQKIFSDTKHKGNYPGDSRENKYFKGYVPGLRFKRTKYYELYGVPKRRSKRGKMVFDKAQSENALNDLQALGKLTFPLAFKKEYFDGNNKEKPKIDKIFIPNARLFTYGEFYEGISKSESEQLSGGKRPRGGPKEIILTQILSTFIDQIDRYFIIKPYKSEGNPLLTSGSKFKKNFHDYLLTDANEKRNERGPWEIKLNWKELAQKLRMNSFIKARQWDRIRKEIKDCYKAAMDAGILRNFELDHHGKTPKVYDILTLNKEYFKRLGWIGRGLESDNETENTK